MLLICTGTHNPGLWPDREWNGDLLGTWPHPLSQASRGCKTVLLNSFQRNVYCEQAFLFSDWDGRRKRKRGGLAREGASLPC